MSEAESELLFQVQTPLGFEVRCTRAWWEHIVAVKHPVMRGRLDEVIDTLTNPDEVRRSRRDVAVYLFYRSERASRWVCAVTRREDGTGFLITTYPNDAIKEGDRIWPV